MGNTPSFVQHALDLLGPLAPVTARSMFGGHGLYADGMMFGLLDDGELFLKTDSECEGVFVAAGCKAWVYPSPNGLMVTSYFQPPAAAMEEPEAMRPWLELALAVARRKAVAKAAKKGKARPAKKAKAPAKAAPKAKSPAKRTEKAKPAKKPAKEKARPAARRSPARSAKRKR